MPFALSASAAATWRTLPANKVLRDTHEYIDIRGYSYINIRIYKTRDAFDLLFRGNVIQAMYPADEGRPDVFSRGDWFALDECLPTGDIASEAKLRAQLRDITDRMMQDRHHVRGMPGYHSLLEQVPVDGVESIRIDDTPMMQFKGTGLCIAAFGKTSDGSSHVVDLERAYTSHIGDPLTAYTWLSAAATVLLEGYRRRPLAQLLQGLRASGIPCEAEGVRDGFYANISGKRYHVWHDFLLPDTLYVRGLSGNGPVYQDSEHILPEEVRNTLMQAQLRAIARDMRMTSTAKQTDHQDVATGRAAAGTADTTTADPGEPPNAVASAWESFKTNYGDKLTGMARRAACRTFVDLVTGNVAKLIAGKDADDAVRSRIAEGLKSPIGKALVGFLISVFVRNTLIRFTKEESDFLKAVTDELEEEAGSIVIGEMFSALVGPLQTVLNIVATQVATATSAVPPTPELPEGIQGMAQDERIHARDKVPTLSRPTHKQVRAQRRPYLFVPTRGETHVQGYHNAQPTAHAPRVCSPDRYVPRSAASA